MNTNVPLNCKKAFPNCECTWWKPTVHSMYPRPNSLHRRAKKGLINEWSGFSKSVSNNRWIDLQPVNQAFRATILNKTESPQCTPSLEHHRQNVTGMIDVHVAEGYDITLCIARPVMSTPAPIIARMCILARISAHLRNIKRLAKPTRSVLVADSTTIPPQEVINPSTNAVPCYETRENSAFNRKLVQCVITQVCQLGWVNATHLPPLPSYLDTKPC